MCDNGNCDNPLNDDRDLSHEEIAGFALALIGGMIENYCEEGYCDPTMYKVVEIAEKLARKFGAEELTQRFAFLKIQAGEVVNKIIDDNNLPVNKSDWSAE